MASHLPQYNTMQSQSDDFHTLLSKLGGIIIMLSKLFNGTHCAQYAVGEEDHRVVVMSK